MIFVLALNNWMIYARVVRGIVLSVEGAALRRGGGDDRLQAAVAVMFPHILPNLTSPLLTLGILEFTRIVLAEAALSFLGLGVQPPAASWGLDGEPARTTSSSLVAGHLPRCRDHAHRARHQPLRQLAPRRHRPAGAREALRRGAAARRPRRRRRGRRARERPMNAATDEAAPRDRAPRGRVRHPARRASGGPRRQLHDRPRRDARPRRRVRLGQERHRPGGDGADRGARAASSAATSAGRAVAGHPPRRGDASREIRGREIALVFQDPMTSLNPLITVGSADRRGAAPPSQAEPRAGADPRRRAARDGRASPAPPRRAKQYPHELSGGMRQRVMIAMAIACEPELLDRRRADDGARRHDPGPDPRAARRPPAALGLSVLLITHDLGVVAGLCDRVAVMYAGQIVEDADGRRDVFERPAHPYTPGLIRSTPRLDDCWSAWSPSRARRPTCSPPPAGCAFRDRCARVADAALRDMPKLEPSRPRARSPAGALPTDAWAARWLAPLPSMLSVV